MQLPGISTPDVVIMAEDQKSRGGRRPSGAGLSLLLTRRNSKLGLPDQDDAVSRRSSTSLQFHDSSPPRRPSIRPGGRPNIGNIGRRISIMRRLSKPAGTLRQEPPPPEPIVLPTNPRFVSLLSAEAQYSALKCYEDLLYERILQVSPEYSGVIERTPSPPQNLQMLCINDKSDNNTDDDRHSDKDDDGYGSDSDSETKPVYIPLTAITGRSVSAGPGRLPELSREKRLLMSYRFQCAFDILDTLKLREGHLVTSPRAQSAHVDPVRTFSSWHHSWSKEFKIIKKVPASARI